MSMEIETRKIQLRQIEMNYAVRVGIENTVILLHGITLSHESYLRVIHLLPESWDLVIPDLRGHGLSSHISDGYRIRQYVEDIIELLSTTTEKPIILAGHSLGGLLSTYLAWRSDTNLRGLFLEDAPLYRAQMPEIKSTVFFTMFSGLKRTLIKHHELSATVEQLTERVASWPDLFAPPDTTWLDTMGPEIVQMRGRQFHQMDINVLDAVLEGDLLDDFDPDKAISEITCPIFVLAGNEKLGGAMTEADVERVSSLGLLCKTHILKEAGHEIHLQKPEIFANTLVEFVNGLPQEK